jgi:hypothetical protein
MVRARPNRGEVAPVGGAYVLKLSKDVGCLSPFSDRLTLLGVSKWPDRFVELWRNLEYPQRTMSLIVREGAIKNLATILSIARHPLVAANQSK